MNELHRIFLGTIVLCVDDHLAVLDLSGAFAAVEKKELPVDVVVKVLCYGEVSVADEVAVREGFTECHRGLRYVGIVSVLLIYADVIDEEFSL